MRIRSNSGPMEFLRAVNTCQGEVWFCTKEQDRLNLKSVLSQFIFATVIREADILENAWIVCDNAEDEILLKEYLD